MKLTSLLESLLSRDMMWSVAHGKQLWNLPKVVGTVPVLSQVAATCMFWVDRPLAMLVMSPKLRDSALG